MTKWKKPQEWKSGAAIIIVSRLRKGILSSSAASAEQPVGAGALGALRRAGRARGEDHEARLVGRRLEVGARRRRRSAARASARPASSPSSIQPTIAARPSRRRPRAGRRTPRRRPAPSAPRARHLDQLRAGEHRVQVERAGAELGAASVASMKPRWLRHMIPTPSPCRSPSPRRSGRARWSAGAARSKLSAPSSSTIAISSGGGSPRWRCRVAGEAPQRSEGGGDLGRLVGPHAGRARRPRAAPCTSKAQSEAEPGAAAAGD